MKKHQKIVSLLLCLMMFLGMLATPGFTGDVHEHAEDETIVTESESFVLPAGGDEDVVDEIIQEIADAAANDAAIPAPAVISEPVSAPIIQAPSQAGEPEIQTTALAPDVTAAKSAIDAYIAEKGVTLGTLEEEYKSQTEITLSASGQSIDAAQVILMGKQQFDELLSEVQGKSDSIYRAVSEVKESEEQNGDVVIVFKYTTQSQYDAEHTPKIELQTVVDAFTAYAYGEKGFVNGADADTPAEVVYNGSSAEDFIAACKAKLDSILSEATGQYPDKIGSVEIQNTKGTEYKLSFKYSLRADKRVDVNPTEVDAQVNAYAVQKGFTIGDNGTLTVNLRYSGNDQAELIKTAKEKVDEIMTRIDAGKLPNQFRCTTTSEDGAFVVAMKYSVRDEARPNAATAKAAIEAYLQQKGFTLAESVEGLANSNTITYDGAVQDELNKAGTDGVDTIVAAIPENDAPGKAFVTVSDEGSQFKIVISYSTKNEDDPPLDMHAVVDAVMDYAQTKGFAYGVSGSHKTSITYSGIDQDEFIRLAKAKVDEIVAGLNGEYAETFSCSISVQAGTYTLDITYGTSKTPVTKINIQEAANEVLKYAISKGFHAADTGTIEDTAVYNGADQTALIEAGKAKVDAIVASLGGKNPGAFSVSIAQKGDEYTFNIKYDTDTVAPPAIDMDAVKAAVIEAAKEKGFTEGTVPEHATVDVAVASGSRNYIGTDQAQFIQSCIETLNSLAEQILTQGHTADKVEVIVEPGDGDNAYKATIKVSSTRGTAPPAPDKDEEAPTITVTESVSGHSREVQGQYYYCEVPTVVVKDNKGLQSVKVKQQDKDNWYDDYSTFNWNVELSGNPTEQSVDLSGKKGIFTITATDTSDNEFSITFRVEHFLGNNMQRGDYPANCTQPSRMVTVYYCDICGSLFYTITRNYKPGEPQYQAPLGHDWAEQEITVESPCGGSGPVTYKVCKRCGSIEVTNGGDFNLDSPLHQWSHKSKAATCESDGSVYDECDNCGAIKVISVTPAHGHRYGAYVDTKAPDCSTETNGVRTSTCQYADEGCEHPTRTISIPYAHTYKDGVITEATCTTPGKNGQICSKCGHVSELGQYETGLAPHQFKQNADCTQDLQCEVCKTTIKGQESHHMVQKSSIEGHWQACDNPGCTVRTDIQAHSKPDNYLCTESYACPECGYYFGANYASHSVNFLWSSDGTTHWKGCMNPGCTYRAREAAHTAPNDYDCSTNDICSVCNAVVRAKVEGGHNYGSEWYSNDAGHWQDCQNEDCNVTTALVRHTAVDDHDCTTDDNCSTCGYTVNPKQSGHAFEGAVYVSAGENGHYQVCTNAGCTQHNDIQAHTGGQATCVDRAICSVCNTPYGTTNAENHSGRIVTEGRVEATTETEGFTGNQVCEACHQIVTPGTTIPKLEEQHQHDYNIEMADDDGCWKQCSCGATTDYKPHDYETKHDADNHWQECKNCHHQTAKLNHVASNEDDNCNTPVVCECGYEMVAGKVHKWADTYTSDGVNHWKNCVNPGCKATSNHNAHEAEDDGNCETALECEVCGHVIRSAETHKFGTALYQTAEGHYTMCENQGCQERDMQEHTPTEDDGDCSTAVTCTECGYVIKPVQTHSYEGAVWESDGNGFHYRKCVNEGCEHTSSLEKCSGGTATCIAPAVCESCLTPYGEVDKDNHVEGRTIQNFKQPTEEEEGYSGDKYCAGCNELVEHGEVLARLDPEHVHDFSVQNSDPVECWMSCSECGAVDPDSRKPHVFSGDYLYDDTGHYRLCANGCGTKSEIIPHTPEEDDFNCTTALTCTDCGYEYVKAQTHKFDTSIYAHDEAEHWNVCQNEDCLVTQNRTSHRYTDDHNCATAEICEDCGYVIKEAMTHAYPSQYQTNGTEHWKSCLNEGCTNEIERDEHSGGEANCHEAAICDVCGVPYGNVNPNVHKGDTELRNHREATETQDGYTGDLYCLGCDNIISRGTDIPATGSGHVHAYTKQEHDSLYHWMECECGAQSEKATHDTLNMGKDAQSHWTICSVCGAEGQHVMHDTLGQGYDDNGHWGICSVCKTAAPSQHHVLEYLEGSATPTGHKMVCSECGWESAEVAHDKNIIDGNTDGHWYECSVCGTTTVLEDHTFKDGKCTVCGEKDPNYTPPVDKDPADLTKLREAVATAQALNAQDYVDFSAVSDALKAANALLARADELTEDDQDEIDAAVKALDDAVKGLEKKPVEPGEADLTALEEAIRKAEALEEENYKDFSEVTEALTAAKALLDKADELTEDDQDEIDAAVKALEDAIKGLEEKPNTPIADVTALEEAVKKAEALKAEDYKDFSKVTEALNAAKALLAKADELTEDDQDDVDAAVKALNDAIAALEKKSDEGNTSTAPGGGTGNPNDAPRTGDESHLAGLMLAAMAFLSIGTLAAVAAEKRRRESKR